jgi:4-hydroxybenzoate polyprenyltransferase
MTVSEASINVVQTAIVLLSAAISWVIVDIVANLLLKKHEKGTKIRFIGARWLKRKEAIEVAIVQFAIAFFLSLFITDFFASLYSQAFEYLVPIALTTIGILYLYILAGLPYKIKGKHALPSVILILIALFLFYVIWYFTQ